MNRNDDGPDGIAQLRWRAEEIARRKGAPAPDDLNGLSLQNARQTLHELGVRQIELELQNEELRRTQTELNTTRARYFDLYNLAPVGYFVISLEGVVQEANLTAVTLLGIARAALVHQPITRFIRKEDQEIYYQHRKQLLATGEPHACELRMEKKDGTVFWARLTATTGQDTDGAPVTRVVLSDISDRKRMEGEKADLEAQLRQARRHPPVVAETGRSQGGRTVNRK